jgi:putative ATP-dependent endonuclease of the OLD family
MSDSELVVVVPQSFQAPILIERAGPSTRSSVRISELEIKCFRGIKSGQIRFRKLTVLIGANNSGKTTIVEALALLLGRDRLIRSLTEHDFYGSKPGISDRIEIIGTVTDFEPNDQAHHMDWFRQGRGVPKWIDAETGKLKPLQTIATDRLACQIAFAARFDQESLEVEGIRYFYDDHFMSDPFDEESGITSLPVSIIRDLGFFLVPASRTWDRLISFGSELFRRVVSYIGGKPAEAVLEERDRLRSPSRPLEDDPKLKELVEDVNSDIALLFGRPSQLKLRLTTTDSAGLLEAVVPHFAESSGVTIPSSRQGSGLISLQTLILLMRFGHLRVEKGEGFLMALEEPELHVGPALQRKLLHLLQALTTQTIITTHSPVVAAVPAPTQLVIIVNRDGQLQAKPLADAPVGREAPNWKRSLLFSDRGETVSAVMHSHILIPEGKTDVAWLQLLAKIADLTVDASSTTVLQHFTHEVGIVPTKDAAVVGVFEQIAAVHPSVAVLVDGDTAGNQYKAQLIALNHPPRSIIQWPAGWAIEDAVGWIAEADQAILSNQELGGAGIPNTPAQLVTELKNGTLKTDGIAHSIIADAFSTSVPCMRRVRHILALITSLSAGRSVATENATVATSAAGKTKIWTFNNACPGI